jgi:hypothetical protein
LGPDRRIERHRLRILFIAKIFGGFRNRQQQPRNGRLEQLK